MATVFTLAGAFGGTLPLTAMFNGEVTDGHTVVALSYDNFTLSAEAGSVSGAAAIEAAVNVTAGQIVVFGHSLGSVAINRWLHDYGPSSAVGPERLSFVCAANSRRKYGGYVGKLGIAPNAVVPVGNRYTVRDFARQYDGWADWPTGDMNLVALQNAQTGMNTIHVKYNDVSLVSPSNAVFVEGNVTYLLSPTFPLPLIGWRRDAAYWDGRWRPKVELAYNRPMPVSGGGSPPNGGGYTVVSLAGRAQLDATARSVAASFGEPVLWYAGEWQTF